MVRRVPRFVSPSGPTLTERKSRPCVHRVWLPFSKGSVPCAHPDAEDRARPSTSKRPGPGRTRLFWLCPAQRLSPQSRPGILLGKLQVAKGKPGKGRGAGTRHTAPLRPLRKGRHVAGVSKSEKGAQDMVHSCVKCLRCEAGSGALSSGRGTPREAVWFPESKGREYFRERGRGWQCEMLLKQQVR